MFQKKINIYSKEKRMKLLKILKQVITETGDTTNVKTYATTPKTYDTIHKYAEVNSVYFTTDSETRYYIILEKVDHKEDNNWTMTVEFAAKISGSTKFNSKAVVNKGELYKVMATVIKEINKELKESEEKDQHITNIQINPSKNSEHDERRANLYLAYMKANLKNMPAGSKVTMSADKEEIRVLIP
jgi:hypothetical protein